MTQPQCMKCTHYMVTYDPISPRGCRLYQVKSAQMPCLIVKMSTGKECPDFKIRENKKEEKKESFNDPKYWKD